MCGLIAVYMQSGQPVTARLVEDMNNAMTHRGPDDYGLCFAGGGRTVFWRSGESPPEISAPGVAMGHRRMSIFDLSTAGRQPFVSDDGRYTLVFNGEIYNYIELAEELRKDGFEFTTDCDTEVLLKAYQRWGKDCFPRLNGVWAVVVWDNASGELVVARDRLGEKPLFYTQVGGTWLFSSEMKALFTHPGVEARPNEQVVMQFIATGASPLGEDTFYAGIRRLEGATVATFRDGELRSKTRYWELAPTRRERRTDLAEAAEELETLLTDAVRLRMRGDLRVGSMLSGGMDSTSVISSIITVLSGRPDEGRSIGNQLQAFTASFPGLENDETDKVEELCSLIEISVNKVYPAEQEHIEQRLHEVVRKVEAPFWSPAVLVSDSLMQLIRTTDVRVVLDGLGSDEILAGFDWYNSLYARDRLREMRFGDAMGMLGHMERLYGRNRYKELARAVLPESFPEQLDAAKRVLRGKTPYWYSDVFNKPLHARPTAAHAVVGLNSLDRALREATLRDNVPRWTHMADNVSMGNSVVCRSPFLDYRLAEFAFSLDDNLKIHEGVNKFVLREAKRSQLPASIVDDVHKIQLQGPGDRWLRGPLKSFAQSIRDDGQSRLLSLMRPAGLARTIDDFYAGREVTLPVMWRIVNTEAWMRAFF